MNNCRGSFVHNNFEISANGYADPETDPLAAFLSDVRRQDPAICDAFGEGFAKLAELVQDALPEEVPAEEARRRALTLLSAMVGSVAMCSSWRNATRISEGVSDRSRIVKVAIDAGPTSSAGLAIFSPCSLAKP